MILFTDGFGPWRLVCYAEDDSGGLPGQPAAEPANRVDALAGVTKTRAVWNVLVKKSSRGLRRSFKYTKFLHHPSNAVRLIVFFPGRFVFRLICFLGFLTICVANNITIKFNGPLCPSLPGFFSS